MVFPFAQKNKGKLKALRSETKKGIIGRVRGKNKFILKRKNANDPCVRKAKQIFSLFRRI
jgi:hypothetical protein